MKLLTAVVAFPFLSSLLKTLLDLSLDKTDQGLYAYRVFSLISIRDCNPKLSKELKGSAPCNTHKKFRTLLTCKLAFKSSCSQSDTVDFMVCG